MVQLSRHLWIRFAAIATPYWRSNEKRTAWTLLVLLLVLMLGWSASEVLFNQQAGDLASALAAKDAGRFWRTIYECLAMLVVAVPIVALYYFVRDKLSLYWRRWLTRRILNRYLENRAYYELNADAKIDNPDQRIAEDVNVFTQKSLNFMIVILGSLINVAAFSGVLWSISHSLVYFLVIYAFVGTFVTVFLFG